jgi:hypothetical protein
MQEAAITMGTVCGLMGAAGMAVGFMKYDDDGTKSEKKKDKSSK